LVIEGEKMVGFFIALLLGSCCPSAVAGFVISCAVGESVDAVQFGRTFSHVGQKVLERVPPSLADSNADRSPSWKIVMRRICATHFHGDPGSVSQTWTSASADPCVSVSDMLLTSLVQSDWLGQSTLNRPPKLTQTVAKDAQRNFRFGCPVRERLDFALKPDKPMACVGSYNNVSHDSQLRKSWVSGQDDAALGRAVSSVFFVSANDAKKRGK
jgi:hypothetical protein